MVAATACTVCIVRTVRTVQEMCRDAEAALRASERALAALPASRAVRAAAHRLRVRLLPPASLLRALRADLVAGPAHLEAWARLLAALAATAGPEEVAAAAREALAQLRRLPVAYPHVLHAYGECRPSVARASPDSR